MKDDDKGFTEAFSCWYDEQFSFWLKMLEIYNVTEEDKYESE